MSFDPETGEIMYWYTFVDGITGVIPESDWNSVCGSDYTWVEAAAWCARDTGYNSRLLVQRLVLDLNREQGSALNF